MRRVILSIIDGSNGYSSSFLRRVLPIQLRNGKLDPVDQTVLANEQVVDEWDGDLEAPVERREMDQWFMRITDYAEELLTSLDGHLSGMARISQEHAA